MSKKGITQTENSEMKKTPNSGVPRLEEEGNGENASLQVNPMVENEGGRSSSDVDDLAGGFQNLTVDQDHRKMRTDGGHPIILLACETSGRGPDCEILQIAARFGTGNEPFETYINPTQPISSVVTSKNGLTNCDGVLKYNGVKVQSIPLCEAMRNLHSWLASFKRQCYIAIHNLSYLDHTLYDAIASCSLRADFGEVVYGFIDTLSVIRGHTGRKGECSIQDLAEWLDVSNEGADGAPRRVKMLHEILQKARITPKMLTNAATIYFEQMDKWENDKRVKVNLPSLNPLKHVVGPEIRKRMANASITMDILKHTYKTFGYDGIKTLLTNEVNGTKIVSYSSKIDDIINVIKSIIARDRQNVPESSSSSSFPSS